MSGSIGEEVGPFESPSVDIGGIECSEGEKIAMWCAFNLFQASCIDDTMYRLLIGEELAEGYRRQIESVMRIWQQASVRFPKRSPDAPQL